MYKLKDGPLVEPKWHQICEDAWSLRYFGYERHTYAALVVKQRPEWSAIDLYAWSVWHPAGMDSPANVPFLEGWTTWAESAQVTAAEMLWAAGRGVYDLRTWESRVYATPEGPVRVDYRSDSCAPEPMDVAKWHQRKPRANVYEYEQHCRPFIWVDGPSGPYWLEMWERENLWM